MSDDASPHWWERPLASAVISIATIVGVGVVLLLVVVTVVSLVT